jgi:hypothetical protein
MRLFFTRGLAALGFVIFTASPSLASEHDDVIAAVDAIYEVISGPVGQARDFDAMREMFVPNAVLGAVGPGPEGHGRGSVGSVENYIERSGTFLVENGFTERATRTDITVYGELASVRSAYEGVSGLTGEVIVTGVNFITLFKIDGEWKVASLLWRSATEETAPDSAFD